MSFTDLPEVEIIQCKSSCELTLGHKKNDEKQPIPAQKLLRWDEWMQERRRIHQKLGKRTDRNANELLMNTFEDKRETNEKKMVLEYAKIPYPHDYYRGNPSFWKMPTTLLKCEEDDKTYFTVMSKPEKFEIPEMEYIKIPNLIKVEKESETVRDYHWEKDKYFTEKYNRIEVKVVQPHIPVLDDLMVIGNAVVPPRKSKKLKVIQSDTEFSQELSTRNVPCYLIINNLLIFSNETGTVKTTLYIKSENYPVFETAILTIKNKSQFALRFYFVEIESKKSLKQLPKKDMTNRVFYYNRNIQVITPGRSMKFPFWFKTKVCGPYSQTFQMILTPDLWKGNLEITICLEAFSETNIQEKCFQISQNIENKVRTRLIQEILEEVMMKIPQQPSQVKIYSYDRATIFEAINSIYDPLHFRPKYLYDKKVVDELEIFYNRVRLEDHPEVWDYKLDTLRTVTTDRVKADKLEGYERELEEIFEKIEESKAIRLALQKKVENFWVRQSKVGKGKNKKGSPQEKRKSPKKEKKEKKSKSDKGKKGKKGKEVIVEPLREPLPKTLNDHLEDIISKLKIPNTYINYQHDKLNITYSLLCTYFDRISEEVVEMEEELDIHRLLPKMRKNMLLNESRILEEFIDNTNIETKLFAEPYTLGSEKKAPDWSAEIPLEEYKKRYNAFHGIVDDKKSAKSSKKGKGKKDKKDKSPKKSKAKKGLPMEGKRSENLEHLEVEETKNESICDEEVVIPENILEVYNKHIYFIFYQNLGKAIDDVEAMFQLLPDPQIPQSILQRIHNTQFDPMRENLQLDFKVFDLKRTISQTLQGDETVKIQSVLKIPKQSLPPKIFDSDHSLWSVLKAFYPKKLRTRPIKGDEEIFAVGRSPYPPDVVDCSTSMTPEEIILDRNYQTSFLESSTSCFGTDLDETEVDPCTCESDDAVNDAENTVFCYDSEVSFDKVSVISSDEILPCDEKPRKNLKK